MIKFAILVYNYTPLINLLISGCSKLLLSTQFNILYTHFVKIQGKRAYFSSVIYFYLSLYPVYNDLDCYFNLHNFKQIIKITHSYLKLKCFQNIYK